MHLNLSRRDLSTVKRPLPSVGLEPSPLFRRSARPENGRNKHLKEEEQRNSLLPSPTVSTSQQLIPGRKRKRSLFCGNTVDAKHNLDHKSPKSSHQTPKSLETDTQDPVAYWALHQIWPPNFNEKGRKMSSGQPNKRKSESKHRSDRLFRMEQHGIFMKTSNAIQGASEDLCNELTEGNRAPISYPTFPAERVSEVLEQVANANEGKIQRDILPWVVPSAVHLRLWGESGMEHIAEEIQAEWKRCATMGSTCPKPDYTVGLTRNAFSRDEFEALQNYATTTKPFLFTPELCFPFLVCEAKSGEEGLNKAHRQNIHSASIAIRAIIELCWAAYGKSNPRVQDLYGQVLVFTVSHNHEMVYLSGHFAALADGTFDKLEFYRYPFAMFSLSLVKGRDRNKPYNVVRNIYDKFAPVHVKRIKDAAQNLPKPGKQIDTSSAAYDLSLDDVSQQDPQDPQDTQDTQDTPSQSDSVSQPTREPSSTTQYSQVAVMRTQMNSLMQHLGQRDKQMEEQKAQIEEQKAQIEELRASIKISK